MELRVEPITDPTALTPWAHRWDQLAAGVPFRGWYWNQLWWKHYATADVQLLVVAVFDGRELVGLLPCQRRYALTTGWALELLGGGEVCSDYLGLLAAADYEELVAMAVADWLADTSSDAAFGWDLVRLAAVDADDRTTGALVEHLAARRHRTARQTIARCWRLALPADWAAYEALLSKSHRKQVRRLMRSTLESGRAVLRMPGTFDELEQGRRILVDLHQRRRLALGQPGSFASPRFAAFHAELMRAMFATGRLRLHWVEMDGQPLAAEYHLAGDGVIYAYQSGVDPDRSDGEPGRVAAIAIVQQALDEGWRAIDFLRGDEPYKAHWRAGPRPLVELRVAARRPMAELRFGLWQRGSAVKRWVKPCIPQGKSV